MTFQFYGYTVRSTTFADRDIVAAMSAGDPCFWLKQESGYCESFIVLDGRMLPLGLFQTQHVGKGDQVRLAFQASPTASAKKILQAITKLVPLIEQALSLRGVRAIFFTSHSSSMATFMEKRLCYQPCGEAGPDGVMLAKAIGA